MPKHISERVINMVSFGDENWNKMINIMMGIEKAVNSVRNLDKS